MHRRFALLLVVLAAALLPAVPAAGAKSFSTKVVVSLKFPAFHGKLKSAKKSCRTDRRVQLFRQRPGPDRLLGTDRSNAKAKWSIPIGNRLPSGASYYAKAPRKGNCKPSKSKVLEIG
jgi:hypothetical protein